MSQKPLSDPSVPGPEAAMPNSGEDSGSVIKNTLSEHKGKLAIGVAATLGLMVFYKWREKQLAKDNPEDYARLQRLKAGVKTSELQENDVSKGDLAPSPATRRTRKEKGADVG